MNVFGLIGTLTIMVSMLGLYKFVVDYFEYDQSYL